MTKNLPNSKIKKELSCFLIILISSLLFSGCQGNPNQNLIENLSLTNTTSILPTETMSASSYLISPCDLVEQQYFNNIFQDATLFTSFKDGTCTISNQWDTKTIQYHVSQGEQANQAIR